MLDSTPYNAIRMMRLTRYYNSTDASRWVSQPSFSSSCALPPAPSSSSTSTTTHPTTKRSSLPHSPLLSSSTTAATLIILSLATTRRALLVARLLRVCGRGLVLQLLRRRRQRLLAGPDLGFVGGLGRRDGERREVRPGRHDGGEEFLSENWWIGFFLISSFLQMGGTALSVPFGGTRS